MLRPVSGRVHDAQLHLADLDDGAILQRLELELGSCRRVNRDRSPVL